MPTQDRFGLRSQNLADTDTPSGENHFHVGRKTFLLELLWWNSGTTLGGITIIITVRHGNF